MLLTSARVVPHIARARFDSSFGAIVTLPSAMLAVTSLPTTTDSVPSRPFAVSRSPARSTVTPSGIATGFLPMRDIAVSSKYPTQHLAADVGGTGLVVRHDAARGRQDRDAEPVIDPRQVRELRIDPPARLRDARNLADHRLAVDIFQLDLELRDAGTDLLLAEAADIALALQYLENVGAQAGGRRRDDRVMRPLAVAD